MVDYIFQKILIEIPKEIKEVEHQIKEKQVSIQQKEQDNRKNLQQIFQNQAEIADKVSQIKKLQQHLQNNDSATLKMELETYAKDSNNMLKKAQGEFKKAQSDLDKHKKKQERFIFQIYQFNQEISIFENLIEQLTQEIDLLSQGNTVLYQEKIGADDDLTYYLVSTEQLRTAFDNITKIQFDGQSTTVKAREYTGKMLHHILIDKEFYIVPKGINNENWQAFYDQEFLSEGLKYKSIIEGSNWEFKYGMKAHPDRKKMVYSIITTWSAGNPLPWFIISHDLPNRDINEATIINKYSQIDVKKIRIKRKQEEVSELQKENENIEQIIKLKNEELIINKKKIEELKIQQVQQINDQVIQFEQYIKDSKYYIEQLRKLIDITKDGIIPEQQIINKKNTDLLILKQQLLHFAIIINYKKDISHLLMELIKISIDVFGMDQQIIDSNFVPQIKSYSEYYDKNMKNIESLCEETFTNYRAQYQKQQS